MAEIKTGHGVFSNMSTDEFKKMLDDCGIEYHCLGEHINRLELLKNKSQSFARANSECGNVYQNDIETLEFVIDALKSAIGLHLETKVCKFCDYDKNFYPYFLPNVPDRFVMNELTGKRQNTYIDFDKDSGDWFIAVPMGANIPITHCPYCGRELKKT